jgi:hypothetical protein
MLLKLSILSKISKTWNKELWIEKLSAKFRKSGCLWNFLLKNWIEYKLRLKIKITATWTNLYLWNMKLTNFIGYIKIIETVESWVFSKFKDCLNRSWIRVELEKHGFWKSIIDTFPFFSFDFFLIKGVVSWVK